MGCCGDCCVPPSENRDPIKYDPDFNGPIHNRSCTDVIWIILLILFLGVWGYVGYYGYNKGNVDKLLAPVDSNGLHCGVDAGVKDQPYLVFFDITKCLNLNTPIVGCPTPQVCVTACPNRTVVFAEELRQGVPLEELKQNMVCDSTVNIQTLTYNEALTIFTTENDLRCAKYVIKSQNVLFRCIATDLSKLKCKDATTTRSPVIKTDTDTCVRNPKVAQESLLNRATALDTYIGWIVARWVTFFTTNANDRDAHVVVLQRCIINMTDAINNAEDIFKPFEGHMDQVMQDLNQLVKWDQLSSQIVQDLVQSRWYLAGALVGVVVLCFIYILLLRWVVGPVVWTSIVGLFALMGFALYQCYLQYRYYRDHPVSTLPTTNLKGYLQSWFTSDKTWLGILIILAILLVILLFIVIFLRGRITIAIALIREGSKAVSAVKTTVFFPILPWIFQCAVIFYGVVVFMYLLSIGDPAFRVVNLTNDTDCECTGGVNDYDACSPETFITMCHDKTTLGLCKTATCYFTGIDNPHNVIYLHLVNLLGFFWTMFFISGAADMMLASTFSTWYWTLPKRNLPFFTLTSGVYRTMRYHLGTVAFGALIIAIVRVIRVILEYIDHKLKKFDNPFTRCLMCCCKCFFWCLENFIKFINKNAYIMCAVHGKNFCASARDAFSLLMRNIVRVVILDKVMDFVFFLSKLLISIGVGFAVYYLMQWKGVYEITNGHQLNYSYIPAIILSIATYLICSIFFNVYAMAVDTLFLCFLEDCERNDGSPEKPYFMSTNLMKILGKKNKKA